jgi:hypothetical protein
MTDASAEARGLVLSLRMFAAERGPKDTIFNVLIDAAAFIERTAAPGVTEEMVERFCVHYYRGYWEQEGTPESHDVTRKQVGEALTAALTPKEGGWS